MQKSDRNCQKMSTVLYLKGSNILGEANRRLGDCFKCHKVFLIMRLKKLDFEIHYIDERRKQTDDYYKKLYSTNFPVLVDHDVEYQDADDIAKYLEEQYPEPSLKSNDVVANSLASKATPMSSLNGWIKNTNPNREGVLKEKLIRTLREINDVLEINVGAFLDGDDLKLPDCTLLPKLYHAKVAAKYVKDYDFTIDFKSLKKYLDEAMKHEVFKETCPGEEEIHDKWKSYRR